MLNSHKQEMSTTKKELLLGLLPKYGNTQSVQTSPAPIATPIRPTPFFIRGLDKVNDLNVKIKNPLVEINNGVVKKLFSQ